MRPAARGGANDMELVSTKGLGVGAGPRNCGRCIAPDAMLALPYGRFFPAGAVNTTPSKLFIWVDGDDLFGSEIIDTIDTIDTFQADESASAPPAK